MGADPIFPFPCIRCVLLSRPQQPRARAVRAAMRTFYPEAGWARIGFEGKGITHQEPARPTLQVKAHRPMRQPPKDLGEGRTKVPKVASARSPRSCEGRTT